MRALWTAFALSILLGLAAWLVVWPATAGGGQPGALSLLRQAQVAHRQADWLACRQWATAAAAAARRAHDPMQEAQALTLLSDALAAANQPTAAYDTLKRVVQLHDQQAGQDKVRALATLQAEFDTSRQQARRQRAAQQRRIGLLNADRQTARLRVLGTATLALGGALLAVGALVALLVSSRRRLVRSENALRVANQTKDQLMSVIGHDLRGPVATFQQVTPLLRHCAQKPDPAELRELVDELDTGARHLGALLDNLLHWARAQNGQVVSQPVVLAVAPLLKTAVGLYAPAATAKGVHLHVEVPEGEAWVFADRDLLATVLRNLISNALKFTPPGGTVQVSAGSEAGRQEVFFEVRDTGVGIPPERFKQLFAAGPGRSTPGTGGEPGTGLGLPLVARFVELLGGVLHVESTPGQGTRFLCRLPATQPNPVVMV